MNEKKFVEAENSRRLNVLLSTLDPNDMGARIHTMQDFCPNINFSDYSPPMAFSAIGDERTKYDALVIEPLGRSVILDSKSQKAGLDRMGVMYAIKRALSKDIKVFVWSTAGNGREFERVGYTPEEVKILTEHKIEYTPQALRDALTKLRATGAAITT